MNPGIDAIRRIEEGGRGRAEPIPELPPERIEYITRGDAHGRGGHSTRAAHYPNNSVNGRPKTYFNEWTDKEIVDAIHSILADDARQIFRQAPNVKRIYGERNGLLVRIIVSRANNKSSWLVWDAYPVTPEQIG